MNAALFTQLFLAPLFWFQSTWHEQRVAFYYSQIDSTTFLQWRPATIEGVANICGC